MEPTEDRELKAYVASRPIDKKLQRIWELYRAWKLRAEVAEARVRELFDEAPPQK